MTKLMSGRFLRLWIVPNLIYAVIAWATDATFLITVLNGVLCALAIGVCVAYFPVVRDVLVDRAPNDEADWLGLGIFCAWFSVVIARVLSMTWRYLGDNGDWIMTSDLVTYTQFLSISAAVFHLGAPGALGNRKVPTERWITIGIGAAVSAFLTMGLGWLVELLMSRAG